MPRLSFSEHFDNPGSEFFREALCVLKRLGHRLFVAQVEPGRKAYRSALFLVSDLVDLAGSLVSMD